MKRCAKQLRRGISWLSDRLQLIAQFALEHPTDMALGTVAEVAARAKVQPSAIVRFAHALGYGGFTELQQVFRSRLVAGAVPSYRERIDGSAPRRPLSRQQQPARACCRGSRLKVPCRLRIFRRASSRPIWRAPSD